MRQVRVVSCFLKYLLKCSESVEMYEIVDQRVILGSDRAKAKEETTITRMFTNIV